MTTNNWVVITSINPPTDAVRAFATMSDWHVVVVGDQKTPKDWACENAVYLPPDADLGFSIQGLLPPNHYSRKMLGYLYAMRQGADVIADLDDDTLPLANWGCPAFEGSWRMLYGPPKFLNVYKQFADTHTWPRGFPLNRINQSVAILGQSGTQKPVGVWQSLVDGDPDVDAIYRLTVGNATCFKDKMSPIVLEKGTFCPFNSQNTFWRKEMFPLMYLPMSVSSRFSDIMRGYVAQPVMWADGYQLGFTTATAWQHRNPHDLMQDFRDEMDMYLRAEEVAKVAEDGPAELGAIYARLRARGIADEGYASLNAWRRDVEVLL